MAEDESVGSRTQLLARLQRLTDMTLEDLVKASSAKDADEQQIRSIRNTAVKLVKIWHSASAKGPARPAAMSLAAQEEACGRAR